MIDIKLKVLLVIFSLLLAIIILSFVKKGRLSIKYSLIWIFAAVLVLFVGIMPEKIELLTELLGFRASVNLVIGILLTLLLFISLILTLIISKQKKMVVLLIQKIALLENKIRDKQDGKE